MARSIENFCVGCPQGCINCGRKKDVLVITCDWCGDDIYYPEDAEDVNGNDVCHKCYERFENDELDEFGNEIEEEDVYDGTLQG